MEQWWLVMTRPSSERNDAEQPPRLTTAPSTGEVGSPSAAGSISRPSDLSVSACRPSCSGIHIPPGSSYVGRALCGGATAALTTGAGAGSAGGTGNGVSGPQPA